MMANRVDYAPYTPAVAFTYRLKAKTFSYVTKAATADQLSQAALAVAVLCNDTLNKMEGGEKSGAVDSNHQPGGIPHRRDALFALPN
jgi:hypothetical protein